MKSILTVMWLLLLTGLVSAQSIKAPSEVKGEKARLISVPIEYEGDVFEYDVCSGVDAFREYDPDPKKILLRVLAYADGEYTIVCFTAKGPKSAKAKIKISVGASPTPNPTPDPNPSPTPPDDGALGLSKASREGAAKVDAASRKTYAKALAAANKSLAAKIAAGAYTESAAILEDWRQANRTALGEKPSPAPLTGAGLAWAPWALSVSGTVEALHKSGKLPTKQEWADAFNEIAKGLE